MDPVTALSLAGTIVQFVATGHKLVKFGQDISKSAGELPEELKKLKALVIEIQRRAESHVSPTSATASSQGSNVLSTVAQDCVEVADELTGELAQRRTKRTGIARKVEAYYVAGKYMLKKDDITRLKKRLFGLEALLMRWWESEQSMERHSSVQAKLNSLADAQKRIESQSSATQLRALQSDLRQGFDVLKDQGRYYEELAKTTSRRTTGELQKVRDQLHASHETSLLHTKAMLDKLAEDMKKVENRERLIQSLSYTSIKFHQGNMAHALPGTFEWLFSRGRTTFSQWLEEGNGVFWISGLPGSGKSTLMRFAAHDARTRQHLQLGAPHCRVVTAAHYFSKSATSMQKSQQGLFQNLLHQVFRACPELVDVLCPHRTAADEWDTEELRDAFAKLETDPPLNTEFCFFIDGLNEYDGPMEHIIRIAKSLAVSPHVKVCVSSRAWPAFMSESDKSSYTLRVHEFTRKDIIKYITFQFGLSEEYQTLAANDDRYRCLRIEITDRANGVFQWVSMVVRDLLRDIRDNEPYSQLLTRVDSFPQELEPYYRDILNGIDTIHQREARQIFLAALSSNQLISLLALSYLPRDKDLNLATTAKTCPISSVTADEMDALHREWAPRLQNRCRGLLTITSRKPNRSHPCAGKQHPASKHQLEFLHKTVYSFLKQEHFENSQNSTLRGFDASTFLAYLNLIIVKRNPQKGLFCMVLESVEDFFRHARRVEVFRTTGEGAAVADELDRSVIHLNAVGVNMPQDTLRDILLLWAARFDSVWYVKLRLEQDPTRAKRLRQLLLNVALDPDSSAELVTEWYGYRWGFSLPIASQRINQDCIRMFLQMDADPNGAVPRKDPDGPVMTTWERYILGSTQLLAKDYPKVWQDWCEASFDTIMILLQHGADPDLRVDVLEDPWLGPYPVLGRSRKTMTLTDYLEPGLEAAKMAQLKVVIER